MDLNFGVTSIETWCTPCVRKGCHPTHGYNFVNSWSICKMFSLLQRAVNFQQTSVTLPTIP